MTGQITDRELADALDSLAKAANRLRRLVPGMSIDQLLTISDSSPFPSTAPETLLELDTWAVVAAASMRELTSTVVDLAG